MVVWSLLLCGVGCTGLVSCSDTPGPRAGGTEQQMVTDTSTIRPVTDGPYEERYADGSLRIEGTMRAGQRHGLWTAYFRDGGVQSRSTYVDGVQHGPSVVFHRAGVMAYTGDYANGRQVGEWRYYDQSGALARAVEFDSTGTLVNSR